MPNIDPLVNEVGYEIGSGGMVVLTGSLGDLTLRQVLVDMAEDLDAINVAGAYGLTLEHTVASINASFGVAGSYVLPSGGEAADLLNEMLRRIARDIAAIHEEEVVVVAADLTWNGTLVITTGDTSEVAASDWIRLTSDGQWFEVDSVVLNTSITILNPDGLTIPSGSGASASAKMGIVWNVGHTVAKMPADFLHGGRHMVPNRDSFLTAAQYEWVGEPLYQAALDIMNINDPANGGPDATIATAVTPR